MEDVGAGDEGVDEAKSDWVEGNQKSLRGYNNKQGHRDQDKTIGLDLKSGRGLTLDRITM